MPRFRQISAGAVIAAGTNAMVPPLTGVRAGTVNPAGGLITAIDGRGYKSATLYVSSGAIVGAVSGKVQGAAASGGPYTDVAGVVVAGTAQQLKSLDFEIPFDRPFLSIVLTATNAADVSAAWVALNGPLATAPRP